MKGIGLRYLVPRVLNKYWVPEGIPPPPVSRGLARLLGLSPFFSNEPANNAPGFSMTRTERLQPTIFNCKNQVLTRCPRPIHACRWPRRAESPSSACATSSAGSSSYFQWRTDRRGDAPTATLQHRTIHCTLERGGGGHGGGGVTNSPQRTPAGGITKLKSREVISLLWSHFIDWQCMIL
jgi:hypothetical protein